MGEAPQRWRKGAYEVLIREHHLDSFGHLNNAQYLALFEEARWEFIALRGFGLQDIRHMKMGPVILEVSLKFVREIRLRESIRIDTVVLEYEGRVGTLRQAMFGSEGELRAEAVFKFGLFDLTARKLMVPTPQWLQAIGKVE